MLAAALVLAGCGGSDGSADPPATAAPGSDDGPLKAFPSAYGGGAEVTGARADDNAVLVIIDTLDRDAPLTYDAAADVYSGGIRAAFTDELDGRGRYIVSNVSGVIDGGLPNTVDGSELTFGSWIHFDGIDNVTFFGQSAPRGGLTLHRDFLRVVRSENYIVRYLTVRPGLIQGTPIGDDRRSTPIKIGAEGVIVDHCSISWGGEKGLIAGMWRENESLKNTTVQRSLVADSATLGFSVNGGGNAEDWAGGGNVTWHYNLLAGKHRTPNLGGFDGLGVIQNNVVFSSGTKLATVYHGTPQVNLLGNYYRIFTRSGTTLNQWRDLGDGAPRIYAAGNYYEDDTGVLLSGAPGEDNRILWQYLGAGGPLPDRVFADTPNEPSVPGPMAHPAPLLDAAEALDAVLDDVGHNAYLDDDGRPARFQDSYDLDAIADARAGSLSFRRYSTDWVLPSIPEETRPASYDADRDGMSDAWERRIFGDLSEGYRGDHDGDGYTNIEEYMNQVDAL
ncbi:MAG: hypothetical protein GVY25_00530 [Bacteroidetes bacterium]|jgi:hypothetical protein|nr:hypothetical protein [Bacteroidota bacterium]